MLMNSNDVFVDCGEFTASRSRIVAFQLLKDGFFSQTICSKGREKAAEWGQKHVNSMQRILRCKE